VTFGLLRLRAVRTELHHDRGFDERLLVPLVVLPQLLALRCSFRAPMTAGRWSSPPLLTSHSFTQWQTLAGLIAPKPVGSGLPANSRLPLIGTLTLGKPDYALPTVACTRFPSDPAGIAKVRILYDRSLA